MTRRVLLHVGAPKTGTSFVQDILFTHRATLRERGILYPADRHDAHFLAALDLMELPWGGLEREAGGAWDRLVAEVREWTGTAIISHEILGTASRVHVARALESLGAHDDTEIHIVYSARDLVRQIPAEWQENVKHRRTKQYGQFLEDLRDEQRSAEVAQWFWGVQEVPDVLDRWAESIPRDRVHLVTVPPPGSSPTLLWERFAGLFGIDPEEFKPTNRANTSLGVPESAMVRRLNERLNDVLPNHHYRTFVRELLVHQNLSGRAGFAAPVAAGGCLPLGERRSVGRGSASWRCVGTTSSASSTTWSPGRPCRTSTPTTATSTMSPRRRSTRSRS